MINIEDKLIFGLSNIHYSIDGIAIKQLSGAIELSVEFEQDSQVAYINGFPTIKLNGALNGNGNLSLLGLSFTEMKELLGFKGSERGELYMDDNTNAPYVTLLFTEEKANGHKIHTVLYKCKFDITDIDSSTIKESLEQNDLELEFNCIPDSSRHNLTYFKIDTEFANPTVIYNFFKSIQLPSDIK
ncbi:hypothetical protein KD33_07760 [Clostridium sp. NCR]|nr:hypothetical protein KD33_07760 [Clostridium sp. NCR]